MDEVNRRKDYNEQVMDKIKIQALVFERKSVDWQSPTFSIVFFIYIYL